MCLKRYWIHICIVGAAVSILLFYFMNLHRNWTANEVMNRAQIARMLALMRYDEAECDSIARAASEEIPADVSLEEWYGKYVCVALKEGWMSQKEDGGFHPGNTFTYGDLKEIMENFHLSEELLSFSLKYRQNDGMVPRSQWCEVYQYLCTDSGRVVRQTLDIHGSPANISGLGPWQVLTDKGVKQAEGLGIDAFMDWRAEAYMAGDSILCVIDTVSEDVTMENVWIEWGKEKEVQIFFDGYERTVQLEGRLSQDLEAHMGDLVFKEGQLVSVDYKTSRIKSPLLGMEGDDFILEDYGKVAAGDNLVIYQIYPEPAVISKDMLAADGTVYEFVLQGDKICGIIYQAYSEEKIRVLLHGQSDSSYELSSATFTSEEPFMVISDNEVRRCEGGEQVTLTASDVSGGDVWVKTETEDGKIEITSLERSCGTPAYRGTVYFCAYGDSMVAVNEVGLEDYVAGVIPGEMPVSYGAEALKAQAVCARTFGRRALTAGFRGYPANLDDTVASQVYNNQLECEESIQAAEATRGQVLTEGEELIATYFFSTSCGHTSDAEDVWYDGGAAEINESRSVFLSDDSVSLELSSEADFRRFINLEDGYDYFEEDLPWFRWQVYLTAEAVQSSIQKVCQTDIGRLEEITVKERGESGVLKAIQIKGTADEVIVYGQYNIRQVLSPEGAELMPQSGESVSGWALLPSAYCYMDPVIESGQCEGYLIHGGGYGHGTGMSQNGAMKMAETGKDYREILEYFFPGTQLISE